MTTVLITGANRGIGFELTKQYLNADWRVIACCREPEKADALKKLAEANHHLLIKKLDVGNFAEIQQLAQELQNETIDILINNAGILISDKELNDIKPDLWLDTLKVNTIGPVIIAQQFIKQIANGHNKVIANISSLYASIALNDREGYCMYGSSKTALNSTTRTLANNLKNQKIIVVAIDPGWVKTDMGGADAPLTAENCAKGIHNVLDNLTMQDSGQFISHEGKEVAW